MKTEWPVSHQAVSHRSASGVADPIFAEIPKGNLPLYETLRGGLAGLAVGEPTPWAKDEVVKAAWGIGGEILLRDSSSIIEKFELAGIDRAEPTSSALELLKALKIRGRTIAISPIFSPAS